MKIKLLFAFVALSLVSCTENDDNNPVNPVIEKKLDKITYNTYNSGGAVTYTGKIEFDDSNKILVDSTFNAAGTPSSLKTYTYNENGLLTELDEHGSEGQNNTKYKYDALGRIIESNNSYAVIEGINTIKTFAYNNDNTIAVHENTISYGPGGEEVSERDYTYHVNAAGYIFKSTAADGSIITQAVFEGNNVLSHTTSGTTVSYGFDTTQLPVGQYNNIVLNSYGGNVQNAMMLSGFSAAPNNYTLSRTVGNSSQTYEYEFDAEGYPVKVKFFRNESTQPYQIREIFYQ